MTVTFRRAGPEAFLSFLKERSVITQHAAQRAQSAIQATAQSFDTVMTELGLLGEQDLAEHLSRFLDVPILERISDEVDADLLAAIGSEFACSHAILPLELDDDQLVLAVADPFSTSVIDAVAFDFERTPVLRIFPRRTIEDRIARLKTQAANPNGQDAAEPLETGSEDIERLKDFAREAPVVRFVADIIHQAVDARATDIHVEPLEDHVRIRFRNDGMLSTVTTVPSVMLAGIATRIKILSRLNIAERRLPQDGRMRLAVRGQDIDLRVSVIPSIRGESIVLRILDRSSVDLRLDRLGFDAAAQTWIHEIAETANGIVLVTGPTGSGKTTTLYSILLERSRPEVKIFSVEDPVEYRIPGVTQLQVNPAIDLDFATALRSVLRQDPDIILIGEIRDRETAQIAVQAALTGHLVFSTLHTNSAAGALTRLRDMGIDGYLLGATIRGVLAQRLVRRLCHECKVQAAADKAHASCSTCRGTGYAGRTVLYEFLKVSPTIAAMIDRGANESELSTAALREGLVPMAEYGMSLVKAVVTDTTEIRRVIDLGEST